MKKLFAILALVAFFGVTANAQTSNTDVKAPEKQEVKKCTEAEKAKCEKECEKTGAKCEVIGAKGEVSTGASTEKSCSKGSGSCCSKGTTSAGGSCCQKGGATGSTTDADKKKSKNKTVAVVTEKK